MQKTRVVCIDDEQTGLLRKMILDSEGFEVAVAADGKTGLRLFTQGGIDLVLLDHSMPRLIRQCYVPQSILAYPAEMRQVFSNLLANAIDAVEPGGKIQVSVEQSQLKDSRAAVALVVRDNGSGIADRDRSKLFRPFFKGESGTGLGLWIVNGIVSKHGGGIDVSSNSDGSRGTTFKVILPKGGGPSSCLADALN